MYLLFVLIQVQSPSGMAAQLLGQVIRLPDGQLAQVKIDHFSDFALRI